MVRESPGCLDNKALNRSVLSFGVGKSPDARFAPILSDSIFTTSTLFDASVNAGVIQTKVMMVDEKEKTSNRLRKRWFQFSLRGFLLAVAILSPMLYVYAVPRTLVSQFLADARGRDLQRAYSNATTDIQNNMSQSEFDDMATFIFRDGMTFDNGQITRTGDGELAITVVGMRPNGPRIMYVFVWESGWKFDDFTSDSDRIERMKKQNTLEIRERMTPPPG